MLTDLLMTLVLGVLTAALGLLPAYTLPDLTGSGTALGNALSAGNAFFPVTTLGVCLAVIVGAKLFVTGFRVVVWVYAQIPFKFT